MVEVQNEHGSENVEAMEEAHQREAPRGVFRLGDFEESPYHHGLAENLLEKLNSFYAFLVERMECRSVLVSLIQEFPARLKVSKVYDQKFLSALKSLEGDVAEFVSKAAVAKKIEHDLCPAVLGAEAGIFPTYYTRQFSLWNRAKAMFGDDRAKRLQLQANENARSAAQDVLAENVLAIRKQLDEIARSITESSPRGTDLLRRIAIARTEADVNHVRQLLDDIGCSYGKSKILSELASSLALRIGLEDSKSLYMVTQLIPNSAQFDTAIKENFRGAEREIIDSIRESNAHTLEFPLSYAVTEESSAVVRQINDLLKSDFGIHRDEIILSSEAPNESLEISRGRVLTHSAPLETMLEILRDGALLSVEAQAQEKGEAKRTHGVALVKKNYMEDRYSPESHSLAFGVDKVYGNFVRLKEDAPVTIVLSENYLLSQGYLFQESDGEHLFDPGYDGTNEGKPLRIELRSTPFVFLVSPDAFGDFQNFLLEDSVWSEELSQMDEKERGNWFDARVVRHEASFGELPGAVKMFLEMQTGPPSPGYSGVVEEQALFKGWVGNLKRFFPKEKHYE